MTPWNVEAALHVTFSRDAGGQYGVEGLDGFGSAGARLAGATEPPPANGIALLPCANPAGPFGVEGLIAITLYVCPAGLEDELIEFERDTQHRYYHFMAPVRFGATAVSAG